MSLIPQALHLSTLLEWQFGENLISKILCWGICLAVCIYYYNMWVDDNETLGNLAIAGAGISAIGLVTGIISSFI